MLAMPSVKLQMHTAHCSTNSKSAKHDKATLEYVQVLAFKKKERKKIWLSLESRVKNHVTFTSTCLSDTLWNLKQSKQGESIFLNQLYSASYYHQTFFRVVGFL